jgi:hypothetical protein
MTRALVSQSNYIPWKGFFDLVRAADVFIILDTVQFTRADWRNRNIIKTAHGLRWLTIPVRQAGAVYKPIDQIEVAKPWAVRHWRLIKDSYRNAPAFAELVREVGPLYGEAQHMTRLSAVNRLFLEAIARRLGIGTRFVDARTLPDHPDRTQRLITLCRAVGADAYVTGPAARKYLLESAFDRAGIAVQYADYSGYPTYAQAHGAFEHRVSILDLIAHVGFAGALRYLRDVVPEPSMYATPCKAPLPVADA